MSGESSPPPGALPDAEYVSLVTFRRSGQPVATPVWAAPDAGRLVVWTRADSGKVKRLRHTSRVTVAPCDARGNLRGEPVEAIATLLDDSDHPQALAAMRRRYGMRFRLVHGPSSLWGRLRSGGIRRHELVQIRPAGR